MKRIAIIFSAFIALSFASCDMDGANNPANSAESDTANNTGMEMTGAPANPVSPNDTSVTTTGNSIDTMAK